MIKNSEISKNFVNFTNYNSIPSYIFQNRKYTILEALIVYLRERKKLSFHKISILLNRHVRDIYKTYQNAKRKEFITKYFGSDLVLGIPLSIFKNRNLSPLEAVVSYLKEEFSLTYHEIAILLKRDDRTIWTVYQRAGKKNAKSK